MIWRKVAVVSAGFGLLLLLALHFMPHGRDLNPVDHWLSEYVLSESAVVVWLMRAAFAALGVSAVAASILVGGKVSRGLFRLASVGLVAMIFFPTNPNDGGSYPMVWPPTAGNLHQLMLYVAIGATLLGMAFELRSRLAAWLFTIALCSTAVQTYLVATSPNQMTHYGGITERLIVASMLLWVINLCLGSKHKKAPER